MKKTNLTEFISGENTTKPQEVCHEIHKLPNKKGFNNSFFTRENMRWFYFVINWMPHPNKPLIFLPCSRGEKTCAKRKKYEF